MTDYKSIDNFKPGFISRILKICYSGLIESFPSEIDKFYEKWENEDKEAFSNPETVGKNVFLTCIEDNPVGYFSWDNRQYPVGLVGQNCIIPNFQGQGYGKRQIEYIIRIFHNGGYKEIKAVTGDHDFFIPAQKMYLNCGFKKKRQMPGDLFNLIEFTKSI